MDGKDAGMMLLRDMTVKGTQRALLDGANVLFIPILNVEGHDRFGPTAASTSEARSRPGGAPTRAT